MVMIVADVLVVCRATGPGRRAGGVLIGVAAAIKLTPLAFVVHLLITGRRADAARAAGTFAGLQGLMLLVAPHDTARFWTHTVFDADRIGPVTSSWNQSVSNVVRRLSDSASWAQAATFGSSAVLAVGALVLVRRFHQQNRPVHALLVTAYLTLLVSPVSWIHHWVWVVPLAALLLAEPCAGNRAARLLPPVTVRVFAVRPAHAIIRVTPGRVPSHRGRSCSATPTCCTPWCWAPSCSVTTGVAFGPRNATNAVRGSFRPPRAAVRSGAQARAVPRRR